MWRAESIKGYGNAIVPQVAFELFKQLELLWANEEVREKVLEDQARITH
jgi:hypothetical protein